MQRMTPTDLIGLSVSKSSPTQLRDIGITPCNAQTESEPYECKESELQRTTDAYLTAKGYPFLHIRKAKGNRKGWPDLTILLPNGKTLYVELKVKGGRLTKEQKKFIIDADSLGHQVKICTSIESVIEAIRDKQ